MQFGNFPLLCFTGLLNCDVLADKHSYLVTDSARLDTTKQLKLISNMRREFVVHFM